ncbi:hypothetical protein J6590_099697 [Homalodisca vitripennis]|nr:hypothetical protein J6590_099697 [Homalodisca vitripennis]
MILSLIEEKADKKALEVVGEHSSSSYKGPERLYSRAIPGRFPVVAESSQQAVVVSGDIVNGLSSSLPTSLYSRAKVQPRTFLESQVKRY